jgi:hypothetical protein
MSELNRRPGWLHANTLETIISILHQAWKRKCRRKRSIWPGRRLKVEPNADKCWSSDPRSSLSMADRSLVLLRSTTRLKQIERFENPNSVSYISIPLRFSSGASAHPGRGLLPDAPRPWGDIHPKYSDNIHDHIVSDHSPIVHISF